MKYFKVVVISLFFISCGNSDKKADAPKPTKFSNSIEDASGFTIEHAENYTLIEVKDPWPNAVESFRYVVHSGENKLPEDLKFDQEIKLPIKKIIVTSTTHIPPLEALNEEDKLIGFPGLHYISSEKTRELIDAGKISEIGQNENLNTETLLNLEPNVVVGFGINAANKSLNNIEKMGIPVIYNGDWTEKTPLGKAEWIKFFGTLFGKEKKADSIYSEIKSEYLKAKELAKTSEKIPDVIGGSMFKDVWYMPYGNSWIAQFIKDAHANYLYAQTEGDGSMSLSFESVLEKAGEADFWMSAGQFTSYNELLNESDHYNRFSAVKEKKVYSVSLSKGETGGVIFYELGPQRPDIVLKDLISIFHPELLQDHERVFFKPLND
ncbi:ABC transporter substrate-binding protein [Gramella sp. AN32]|uniref:ABC transporter substrate-binding protein n=1 Tax=Christiangramia antarctica TaxID=2058158 RepID=A0ABW5XD27_9FLAO|nr:ABC transporter substrate-binding protein [Gramella sp. AN32]MCM4156505.1 ABC transporter substrate-binding protein [Gramella sp. AN32]